ncbi:hypothetical protein ACNKHK_06155 [Shigella flexneri]
MLNSLLSPSNAAYHALLVSGLMVKGIINIANSVIQQCQNVWISKLFSDVRQAQKYSW